MAEPEGEGRWRRWSAGAVAALSLDPGRVLPMRQWFLGWRATLEELTAWANRTGGAGRWLTPPAQVLLMGDKAACQAALEGAGVPVPPALGVPRDFDDLWELMRQAGRSRVFLKPCHGSSASGVVALEAGRGGVQAFSTLELTAAEGEVRLYNRRRIQVWRGLTEVRRLVSAVVAERCLAQVWVPKAGLAGGPFDLRVVVIGGRARQVMVRLGRGPLTNSLLGGGKAEVAAVQERMGPAGWARLLTVCEQTMARAFPGALSAGLDVLVEPDFRTVRVLEVNAFGDLLPRLLHEGRDTYSWEVLAANGAAPAQVSATGA